MLILVVSGTCLKIPQFLIFGKFERNTDRTSPGAYPFSWQEGTRRPEPGACEMRSWLRSTGTLGKHLT